MTSTSSLQSTISITFVANRKCPGNQNRLPRNESVMTSVESAFTFAIGKAIVVLVSSVGIVISFAYVGAKRIFK